MPHFLFLQGLPGPSLRKIARALDAAGAKTSRINFNGGDWFDWRFGGKCFRAPAAQFPAFLEDYCRQNAVTAIVLFGESRLFHRMAQRCARDLQLDLYVLEEGYLRPYSVALEHWPAAQQWHGPASLEECDRRSAGLPADFAPRDVPAFRKNRVIDAVCYWLAAMLLKPLFPHYRSHRLHTPLAELILWVRRLLRRGAEREASARSLERLNGARFFLFPLQLDGDTAIQVRSPFSDMGQAAHAIIRDFAAHAPADMHMVVKRHPFDPAERDWRRLMAHFAKQLGIGERLHFIEHGNLDWLLDNCQGVVVVNSTVGQLAVARGRPTKALGRALYAMHGLTDKRTLAEFWHGPVAPRPDAYHRFSRALWADCLVNGGFHSDPALELLTRNAADRMIGQQT